MSQQEMFDQDSAPVERFTLNDDQLFERLTTLEREKLVLAADIAQLKKDAAYHEDENPYGIDKEEIKLIHEAAKRHAKSDYEESKAKAKAIFATYERLTGYNE